MALDAGHVVEGIHDAVATAQRRQSVRLTAQESIGLLVVGFDERTEAALTPSRTVTTSSLTLQRAHE